MPLQIEAYRGFWSCRKPRRGSPLCPLEFAALLALLVINLTYLAEVSGGQGRSHFSRHQAHLIKRVGSMVLHGFRMSVQAVRRDGHLRARRVVPFQIVAHLFQHQAGWHFRAIAHVDFPRPNFARIVLDFTLFSIRKWNGYLETKLREPKPIFYGLPGTVRFENAI